MHLVGRQNYRIIKKLLGTILRKDKDRLVRYNYLKLAARTKEGLKQAYKTLKSKQL